MSSSTHIAGRSKRVQRAIWTFLSLLVFLGIAGCNRPPAPPMRIGMVVWPGYEPLHLARHLGFLDSRDFRLIEFGDNAESSRAFRNGAIEAACLTLDEVIYTLQSGVDAVILLAMDESMGADAILARTNITTMSQLRNKRVGVEPNSIGAYILARGLSRVGMTLKEVTLVATPMDAQLKAYQGGTVDAVATYEPNLSTLKKLGAISLFDSSAISGEVVDVLVVSRPFFQKHPDKCARLQQIWYQALEAMKQDQKNAMRVMAQREKTSPEDFSASLGKLRLLGEQENQKMLDRTNGSLRASLGNLKEVMEDLGLVTGNIDVDSLFILKENRR